MCSSPSRSTRLVLIDRDGVVNEDREDFVRSTSDWVPIEGSLGAISRLNRAGFLVALATNQSGVARGLISEMALEAIHRKLSAQLAIQDGHLDAIFVCHHGPSDGCDCRKPRPGLLKAALSRFDLRAAEAVFIGDRETDLRAALCAGVRPILVRTGYGSDAEAFALSRGIHVADDLAQASELILSAHPGQDPLTK